MTSSTSMNGIRLISGSSGRGLRKFTIDQVARRGESHEVRDQAMRRLLHVERVGIDEAPEVAVEHQRGDRDHQPERRVVERDRDAVREQRRVVAPGRRLRAEDLDHADHRAHQAEQGRCRGDRSERVQVALEAVDGGPTGRFEGVAQGCLGDPRLGDDGAQSGREHGAEDRVLGELVDDVGRWQVRAGHRNHLVEQPRRCDSRRAQARQSFNDQGQRCDRADEQRPDRPTGGLYDRKQYGPFRRRYRRGPGARCGPDYRLLRSSPRRRGRRGERLRGRRKGARQGRTRQSIHRRRGKLCGQRPAGGAPHRSTGAVSNALLNISGKKKLFCTKGLTRISMAVGGTLPSPASNGAAVDCSIRAGRGSADG